MNLREVRVVDGVADFEGYRLPLPRDVSPIDGRVVLGFRPDSVDVVDRGTEGIAVTTEVVEELGADAYLFASLEEGAAVGAFGDIVARIDPRRVPAKGARVTLRIRPDELHLFSPTTGERLN